MAGPPIPEGRTLPELRAAAGDCRACELWRLGTRTVFGEGPAPAELMLIGEQPGDREDLEGHPFVGPAGAILDRALGDAGIERAAAYLTNAVKHFRWTARGKRRIHERPDASHVAACRPWLVAEIEAVRPRLLVCLGAIAAQSVVGPGVSVLRERGRFLSTGFGAPAMPTVHPSSVLRVPDTAGRDRAYADLVADLRQAVVWLRG
ncbi:MAG TPA: UdgX family uracil-DNA binding protein [Terriglobales bacterium]|nr:UdgX family uracil-DNA binding protein [Terriglobales bacterium]